MTHKRGLREQIEIARNPDNPQVPRDVNMEQDRQNYEEWVKAFSPYTLTDRQIEIVKAVYENLHRKGERIVSLRQKHSRKPYSQHTC